LPREQFLYTGTDKLCRLIDEAGHRAGVSRGQAFEDFLTCTVCALSAQQMEEEYLAVIAKGYGEGESGKRGVDSLTTSFATLIQLIEEIRRDILGDLFQGGITYGEAGQFLTPEEICRMLAQMTIDEQQADETVCDPCCGSGRMLLAYAEQKRPRELIGQDVDLRCVKMTSINLALRNL
jgi:type I restriction-modification system DNA methylase subunit